MHILRRCKRIPKQSSKLYFSYLLSDFVGTVQIIISTLVITGFGMETDLAYCIRIVSFGVLHNISSASITAVILERVFTLKASLRNQHKLKRMNITIFVVSFWVFHILEALALMLIRFHNICNFEWSNCDLHEVIKTTKYACGLTMIVYDVILICANISIIRIARRQSVKIASLTPSAYVTRSNESVSSRQLAVLKIIINLVASNILLKAPIIIVMVTSTIEPALRDIPVMRSFRALGYLFIQVNSFINLFLYIWKMKECKMNLFLILSKFSKKFEQKAIRLRFEIFDIPVYENRFMPAITAASDQL
ncbi:uncharacterized protein LOC132713386 [Ruditapes philippinarum]|uniref:uncharacterized protein LOC132713386 n=1 Tax=Ruditapes philippinarum TaxID=129788 RepID=UPI00295B219E|nr:uncharacterized protein LOC132713386 [Ruditapes philippinarum]